MKTIMKHHYLLRMVLLGALFFSACNKSTETSDSSVGTPIIKTIYGYQYKFEGNKVTELRKDEDNQVRYGVLADPHGEYETVRALVQKFQERKVDGVLVAGDLAQHFRNSYSDEEEMRRVLEELAKFEGPVYVIPGNHDLKREYGAAFEDLSKFPNVIDLSRTRVVDGDDADIVSCPEMDDHFSMDYRGGFIGSCTELGSLVQQTNSTRILLSHRPPLGSGASGIDYVPNTQKNVGDEQLRRDMQAYGIRIGIFGHIHEAGRRATTLDGKVVSAGEYSPELLFNPGPASSWGFMLATGTATSGSAGILTIQGDKAKYELVEL